MAIAAGKQTPYVKKHQKDLVNGRKKEKYICISVIEKSEELFTIRLKSRFWGEVFH